MTSEYSHSTLSNICVIDDESEIQLFVGTVLATAGYNLQYAATGAEALTLFSDSIPDIILLDVHLPDINGLELLKEFKKNKKLKDVPVLVMTCDASRATINEAYELNVYDFIEKPINPTLLNKKVESALERKHIIDELQVNENNMEKIQRIAGVGTWEYDSRKDEIKCSDEMDKILGVDSEAMNFTLHSFMALTHENDIDEVSTIIHEAIQNKIPYAVEHRIYDDDGFESIVLHQGEVISIDGTDYFKINATMTDITDRKNSQELIEYTTFYDKLTGLPNRSSFCDQLGDLMLNADKSEKLLGVVFLGIDRFKNINESLGHSVGDELLIEIKESLSGYDQYLVSRFSGDVFAIGMPDMCTIDNIIYEASEIKNILSDPYNIAGHELYVTVSIGISVYPLHYGGKDELINNAESAMHFSKNSGGNRISCFDRQMTYIGKKRLFIETDLRKALDKDQFEVYYQPQVAVQNRRLVGMEALIRWNHPEHGLISPDDFIPIAEETGLIVPIGQWVLETATKQVAEWINKGYGLLRVGINLSAIQFENNNLILDVEKVLSQSGLLPCSLDLEVTESSAMRNVKQTISILNAFSEMGVQTSMDDFGTGYSSLSYLQMMPLHTLKIDRAFVKDIQHDGKNGDLARMIISMCHSLGLNVIAEGVENEGHMNFLLKHQCIEAQGYLFSPPVNKIEFGKILDNFSTSNIEYEKPVSELLIFG